MYFSINSVYMDLLCKTTCNLRPQNIFEYVTLGLSLMKGTAVIGQHTTKQLWTGFLINRIFCGLVDKHTVFSLIDAQCVET